MARPGVSAVRMLSKGDGGSPLPCFRVDERCRRAA
jgi:hypothetical protein